VAYFLHGFYKTLRHLMKACFGKIYKQGWVKCLFF